MVSTKRAAPPARRRDEAKALFRNAILDAGELVFTERGFNGARIQDIAARAGIGVGTVYNHFRQKEDVLCALVDERTDALLAQLDPPPDGDTGDFAARLTARLERMFRYVESHRGFFFLAISCGLMGTANSETSRALGAKGRRRIGRFPAALKTLVEEGISAGDLKDIDADHLAAFLAGTIRAFTLGALVMDENARLAPQVPVVVRLFLHGAARRKRK